jgi:hypothetical protein
MLGARDDDLLAVVNDGVERLVGGREAAFCQGVVTDCCHAYEIRV